MLGAGAGAEPPYVSWLILLRDQAMAMEKRRQVVAETLWTVPAADMAHTMQNTTWGEERRGHSQNSLTQNSPRPAWPGS